MERKKVALGMSGGVDSSLCAHLLVEQGYEVTGVYLECWRAPGCRTDEDRADALKVALELNVPFKVLDFKQTYKDKVVEYFFDEYEAGRTPNPDVLCNKEIKFGLFYDWAMQEGFDFVATGHYADIQEINDKKVLTVPEDAKKDQTYFLYRIEPHQLNHILFPLAAFTKKEVREEAKKRKLPVADKKDSVGICFIGDINVHSFLKERLGENPGEVIDVHGNVIGNHTGLWFYTIGQRHGFTINSTTSIKQSDGTLVDRHNIPPFYVIDKLPKTNQLVVGFGSQTERAGCNAVEWHWTTELEKEVIEKFKDKLAVRIRHTGALIPATVSFNIAKNAAHISFAEPARGVAAGQSAVLYGQLDQNKPSTWFCLGGGVINLS